MLGRDLGVLVMMKLCLIQPFTFTVFGYRLASKSFARVGARRIFGGAIIYFSHLACPLVRAVLYISGNCP